LSGFQSPTVIAVLGIPFGMIVGAWIIARALKRFGRGLTEAGRALNTFTAELKNSNQIAGIVAGHQSELEQLGPLTINMDSFLSEFGGFIRLVPGIDAYLRREDGAKYEAAMAGEPDMAAASVQEPGPPLAPEPLKEVPLAAVPPAALPGPVATYTGPQGPNPRYPELPFDPTDPADIERHLLTLIPEGASLDDPIPQDMALEFGVGHTWRRWAYVQTNLRYQALFQQYGLSPLGSDATMSFQRPEPPPAG